MKKVIYLLIFCFIFLMFPLISKASSVTGFATTSDTLIASGANLEKPNGSCLYKNLNGSYSSVYAVPGKLHCLDAGDMVTVLNYDSIIQSTLASCKAGYYYVSYTTTSGKLYNGYVCADYVNTNIDTSKYADEFRNSNIPEIYWDKLTLLKDQHPNWKFKGYKTGLDWNNVISNESIVGMNYIQSSNPIYLSLDSGSYNTSNNTYNMLEAGGWYAANKQTVAYYMDPRNSFDEKSVFMFENLGYNSSYQTENVIQKILNNTDLYQYSRNFIDAATFNGNNVSPVMLAARSRQEVVLSDGKLSNSANGSSGYYNFYNLGAFSSCSNPIECAISFASGYNGEYTTFNRPWRDANTAILNGAQYIANGYINQKQNTLYFQKFNVTSNSYGNYSHQYMTNVQAPMSEAKSAQASYSAISGLLDSEIEFVIPVYENMSSSASTLPTSVDQSELDQKKEEQNQVNVGDIISKAGYSISGEYLVNVNIGTTASQMISKIGNNAIIYKDNVSISGNEVLGTADILKVKINNVESSFRIIVYGDANGDGKISAVDYVKIKNYIMGASGLTGSFKVAADANRDGKITAVDYVNIKNYIMGNSSTLR